MRANSRRSSPNCQADKLARGAPAAADLAGCVVILKGAENHYRRGRPRSGRKYAFDALARDCRYGRYPGRHDHGIAGAGCGAVRHGLRRSVDAWRGRVTVRPGPDRPRFGRDNPGDHAGISLDPIGVFWFFMVRFTECGCGGTGRRTRFRFWRGDPWGFESLHPHQPDKRSWPARHSQERVRSPCKSKT